MSDKVFYGNYWDKSAAELLSEYTEKERETEKKVNGNKEDEKKKEEQKPTK